MAKQALWSAQACLRLGLRQLAAAGQRNGRTAPPRVGATSPGRERVGGIGRSKLRQTKAVASYRTPNQAGNLIELLRKCQAGQYLSIGVTSHRNNIPDGPGTADKSCRDVRSIAAMARVYSAASRSYL